MIKRPAHNVIKLFALTDVVIILHASIKRIAYSGKTLVCLLRAIEPADLNKVSFFSSKPLLQIEHPIGFLQDPKMQKLKGQRYRVLFHSYSGEFFTLRRVKENEAVEI